MRNVGKEFILELKLLPPAHVERGQQSLAFNGIAHGARQLLAVEIALDQVILDSLMDRVDRQCLRRPARKARRWGRRARPRARCGKFPRRDCREGSDRAAPWRAAPRPWKPAGGEPRGTGNGDIRMRFHQAQPHQVGVSRVVFDQQDMGIGPLFIVPPRVAGTRIRSKIRSAA